MGVYDSGRDARAPVVTLLLSLSSVLTYNERLALEAVKTALIDLGGQDRCKLL
jgi:hypothetical protein